MSIRTGALIVACCFAGVLLVRISGTGTGLGVAAGTAIGVLLGLYWRSGGRRR